MTTEQLERLCGIYRTYNELIKPLIADLEARYERMPIQLFNEIRAIHDHISRCYFDEAYRKQRSIEIDKELEKAEGHVCRIVLDCFKYLIVYLADKSETFRRRLECIENVHLIEEGQFYAQYQQVSKNAVSYVREAKKCEGVDKEKALELFQKAYNEYTALEILIDRGTPAVSSAVRKQRMVSWGKVVMWIGSVLLSSCVGWLLSRYFF